MVVSFTRVRAGKEECTVVKGDWRLLCYFQNEEDSSEEPGLKNLWERLWLPNLEQSRGKHFQVVGVLVRQITGE